VLRATAEQLGRVGYESLRIEDVAAGAGVNKTTIYRRWPTKPELVAAAVKELAGRGEPIDTGKLREDLRRSLLDFVAECAYPLGRGIVTVLLTGRTISELDALVHRLGDERHSRRVAMVERGIARGELPEHVDPDLFVDLVTAPIFHRVLTLGEVVDAAYIDRVLDTMLAGAGHSPRARRRR